MKTTTEPKVVRVIQTTLGRYGATQGLLVQCEDTRSQWWINNYETEKVKRYEYLRVVGKSFQKVDYTDW